MLALLPTSEALKKEAGENIEDNKHLLQKKDISTKYGFIEACMCYYPQIKSYYKIA